SGSSSSCPAARSLSLCLFLSVFCCKFAPRPRVLHSFPTRRSSDLGGVGFTTGISTFGRLGGSGAGDSGAGGSGSGSGSGSRRERDRKSTRLNSSHVSISYAVFCLKKKTNNTREDTQQNHTRHDGSI